MCPRSLGPNFCGDEDIRKGQVRAQKGQECSFAKPCLEEVSPAFLGSQHFAALSPLPTLSPPPRLHFPSEQTKKSQ
jgi:hypothetical protein